MKTIKYILLIIISLFLLNSCGKKGNKEQETTIVAEETQKDEIKLTKAQFESEKMQLGSLIKQNFPQVINTTGIIDIPPHSKETITSFYGGSVKKSNLLIGDKIRKGQAVVVIENPKFVDMQQEYLEIKEQLTYLQSEYQRQKTLFNENITSEKKYLKAASNYKRQKAKLNGMAKKLRMLNINIANVEQGNIVSTITLYASINGVVSKINIHKGMYIMPEYLIMEIINTDYIQVELSIFEKDAMNIEKGQKIRFKIPEASDIYYDAIVHLVGKAIDEKTRTIKVYGRLEQKTTNNFNIGMFVDAEIVITKKEGLALPDTAIMERKEHFVILKLTNKTNENYIFEPIEIQTGLTYNGFSEIVSNNIKETDEILIIGAYSLVGEN